MNLRPLLPGDLLSLLSLLSLAACTTRVVDLPLPDAGPGMPADAAGTVKPEVASDVSGGATREVPPRCEMVKRDDGAVCTLCFAPDGTVAGGSCQPVPMPPPPPDAASAIPTCKVVPRGDLRCRSCSSAAGEYTACLTCQMTMPLGGEQCRACAWTDLPDQRCLQCFGADGGVSHDDCDNFRKEVVAPGGV